MRWSITAPPDTAMRCPAAAISPVRSGARNSLPTATIHLCYIYLKLLHNEQRQNYLQLVCLFYQTKGLKFYVSFQKLYGYE